MQSEHFWLCNTQKVRREKEIINSFAEAPHKFWCFDISHKLLDFD